MPFSKRHTVCPVRGRPRELDPARRPFHEFHDRLHTFTVRNVQSTGGPV